MLLGLAGIKIVHSSHALRRALERGISKEDIETVVLKPQQKVYDNERKNWKSVRKIEDKYNLKEAFLVVIHTREVDRVIHIISVMITSRGGLGRFGFNNI